MRDSLWVGILNIIIIGVRCSRTRSLLQPFPSSLRIGIGEIGDNEIDHLRNGLPGAVLMFGSHLRMIHVMDLFGA